MSEFFQHYPQIDYNISGTAPPKFKTAINILERAKFRNVVMNDIVQYFPYSIPEAERPDITSFNIYGDVKFTWLIFLINDIHDPIYDWPLATRDLVNYIKDIGGINNLSLREDFTFQYEINDRNKVRDALLLFDEKIKKMDTLSLSVIRVFQLRGW